MIPLNGYVRSGFWVMAAGLVVGNVFLVALIEALLFQIVNPSIHNN